MSLKERAKTRRELAFDYMKEARNIHKLWVGRLKALPPERRPVLVGGINWHERWVRRYDFSHKPFRDIKKGVGGIQMKTVSDEILKRRIGIDLDLCWFPDCKAVWPTEEGIYCPTCDTFKCPSCGRCFCDLPPFTQYVLDAEMASIGLWQPFSNPKKRKKRRKYFEFEGRSHFLEWAKVCYPDEHARYSRGEITFDELVSRIRIRTDRGVLIK